MLRTKRSIFSSAVALLLCFSLLLGTSYAWFTDSAKSGNNVIQSGTLDVEMYWSDSLLPVDSDQWQNADGTPIFTNDKWEPGVTEIKYIKVKNAGNLSMQWRLFIEAEGAVGELADVIDVYYINPVTTNIETLHDKTSVGVLTDVLNDHKYTGGVLLPAGASGTAQTVGETILAVAFHMQEEAGNTYQGKSVGDGFSVRLIATQFAYESDAFGPNYDQNAQWPNNVVVGGNSASAAVTPDADNKVSSAVSMTSSNGVISASVPAGVKLAAGANKLTLNVSDVTDSKANISLNVNEASVSIDVHINGVAEDNDVVMAIAMKELLPVGLNMGNYRFYHVEDGNTVEMTLLADGATPVHNNYEYDPATGDVVLHLKSFSEVALVADTEKAWEGKFDYTWYDASKTELTIANADQLAAFGAIVGGMNGQNQDSFKGKTVKLVAGINLGDKESENNPNLIFYPIGYYNSEGTYERTNTAITSGLRNFEGTFDGNGNTIANFYHNTWEMKGDHDWYSPEEQYYRDGMGLFGRVYKGTVKNLTVKNFSSDGEIATTGVIAAYADGATFENIAIFNCNPRVYNIGNGGIVGCVGWYAKEADLKTTFKNITVDNSNKISALWGSYDVACGGIVGQYYPTSGQTSAGTPANGGISFENCHISAQMDVYNDVCANYQYYAYRYTGMLIGSVRENVTIDGKSYPKMDGITASGCTVHFGTWNDYYYCEIIDNTTASYTHDYQMSRLTEIKAIDGTTITYLDGTTGTVPASGRANYVIVDYTKGHGTENATCYHFKDGAVWTHDMGGIQTGIDENGDGQDDLKEDKQHIYLEFNNLVTGYGWGVTTKAVGDLAGVTILDREVADSVDKFKPSIQNGSEFVTESKVTIGELFAAIENAGVAIKSDNVQVTVSPFGATSTAGGTYVANVTDWTQGTLTFSGIGQAVITITDYYFCKTTTVTVTIIGTEKFNTNFVNYQDYLYRVGNADKSTVALGTIFKHSGKGTINSANVDVTFATVAGNAGGTFTANNSDWTKGTIQFTGTGVVKVTIKDNTSKEFVLNLEVVDAVNAITATSATSNNVVLLNNVPNGSFSVSGGYTFYGNGFKVTLPTGSSSKWSGGFVGYINLDSGNLDNVQIIGHVFPTTNIYREQAGNEADGCTYFHNSVIINSGNCKITNSYISGSRAAIYVKGGNDILIENTTVSGGAYANLEVSKADSVTLRNITTEQKELPDSYNAEGSKKNMIGSGIVIGDESTEVYVEGTLDQYNWITAAQWSAMLGSYESQFPKLFTDSAYSAYWHYKEGDSATKYVNLAMIFACDWDSSKLHDNRTDKSVTYQTKDVTVAGESGAVFSTASMGTLVHKLYNAPEYLPNSQYSVAPETTFDFTNKNYQAVGSTNDYCYIDGETVKISFDEGGSKIWDTSILTATKVGNVLSYTVSMDRVDYTGKNITFTAAGDYVVTYTYCDPYNYKLDEDGNVVSYSKEYTEIVNINVTTVAPSANNAEFTMGSNGNAVNKILVGNDTYLSASNIVASTLTNTASATFGTSATAAGSQSINYSGKSTGSWASTTIDGNTYYFPVVAMGTTDKKFNHTGSWYGCFPVFDNAITITDYADGGTGAEVVYNSETTTLPANLAAIYPQPTFRHQGTRSSVPTTPSKMTKGTYSGKLCYTTQTNLSASNERNEEWILAKYTYTDNAGKTYYWFVAYYCAASTDGTCITPDTLITLADGTQVRVDSLTGNEKLLVWNHENGKLEKAPVAYIVDHEGVVSEREIIHLTFANGKTVKIIGEHVFFDVTLNKYVAIDTNNAESFIGHTFAALSADGTTVEKVALVSVEREIAETLTYEVVSYKHLTCFTEGILSTSAFLDPLLNVFDICEETLAYDAESVQNDIATYGLYTYADFDGLISEEAFELYNAAYLKIAVGKGYITWNDILDLIDIYFNVGVTPIEK